MSASAVVVVVVWSWWVRAPSNSLRGLAKATSRVSRDAASRVIEMRVRPSLPSSIGVRCVTRVVIASRDEN